MTVTTPGVAVTTTVGGPGGGGGGDALDDPGAGSSPFPLADWVMVMKDVWTDVMGVNTNTEVVEVFVELEDVSDELEDVVEELVEGGGGGGGGGEAAGGEGGGGGGGGPDGAASCPTLFPLPLPFASGTGF